jgi:pimeloyl-ACP methyl ester carboxylesterase
MEHPKETIMHPEKSTNDRSFAPPAWLRRLLSLTQSLSPTLAAALAHRLFLTPPPVRPLSSLEADVLAAGESLAIDHQGGRLAVWRWGQGPAVVLVHGWGGRAGQMTTLVGPLLDAGFSVLAFDEPGHGDSPGRYSSLPHFARAVTAVVEAFGPIFALVGHSMGGAASSLAVADGLSVERGAFIASPADARAWFAQFCAMFGLKPHVAALALQRIESHVGVPLERLHAGALGRDVTLPLLVIHDRHDREIPWSAGLTVVEAFANATLDLTEGLGHRRILRDAGVVSRVVEFLTADSVRTQPHPLRSRHLAVQHALLASRCARCERSLDDSWSKGPLCDRCALDIDLFERSRRQALTGSSRAVYSENFS